MMTKKERRLLYVWEDLVFQAGKSHLDCYEYQGDELTFPYSDITFGNWEGEKMFREHDMTLQKQGVRVIKKGESVTVKRLKKAVLGHPLPKTVFVRNIGILSSGSILKESLFAQAISYKDSFVGFYSSHPLFTVVTHMCDKETSVSFLDYTDAWAELMDDWKNPDKYKTFYVTYTDGFVRQKILGSLHPPFRSIPEGIFNFWMSYERLQKTVLLMQENEELFSFWQKSREKERLQIGTWLGTVSEQTPKQVQTLQDLIDTYIDEIHLYLQTAPPQDGDVRVFPEDGFSYRETYRERPSLNRDGSLPLDWKDIPERQRFSAWKKINELYMKQTSERVHFYAEHIDTD